MKDTLPPDPLPHLEISTLVLRPFTPGDAKKVFAMSREAGMRKWLPSQVYRDEAHAAEALASLMTHDRAGIDPRKSPCVLGIELKPGGDLVGHVGLSPLDGEVEIGFAVAQSQQGKGVATQAVQLLCEWAAVKFPGTPILGIAARENHASQAVLIRAGFRLQAEKMMRLQGLEQTVMVFAYAHSQVNTARE